MLRIHLVLTRYDGWRWAICKPGSWKPIVLTPDLAIARDLTTPDETGSRPSRELYPPDESTPRK